MKHKEGRLNRFTVSKNEGFCGEFGLVKVQRTDFKVHATGNFSVQVIKEISVEKIIESLGINTNYITI